ncbi:2-phospho-L-lactate guanylyltransferase [Aeromicrobium flavum]|uniref:2-phospho-L-lactate guanylyltransferase n=1 Tax=Aeromicrobium flavum TaxID=416568 RepID=A0A512HVA9_9ACTN|nr:2-phospho-L-lactate guanylyltransferase [Aeromicrobium flavum]GEO89386.1 2-phospho-L-lactate guanylyltransferase [Aeromicrobium flavum]
MRNRRRHAWTVVIPVKPATHGKSRLEIPGVDRVELARAIALDTIAAAAEVARVVVVTADPTIDLPGVEVVVEPAARGIAVAVADGLAVASTERRAVLLGDVPGLRPADLSDALALAEGTRLGAVPDEERHGTTLVTAREGDLPAAFGPDSWAKHQAAGFAELLVPASSTLRRDVDRADHLVGVLGPRTSAVLARVP